MQVGWSHILYTMFVLSFNSGSNVSVLHGSMRGHLQICSGSNVLLLRANSDAWFLNSQEESLGFVLADEGFDVCVGNVRGTRRSHGHRSLSEETEMMRCVYRQQAPKSLLLDIRREQSCL